MVVVLIMLPNLLVNEKLNRTEFLFLSDCSVQYMTKYIPIKIQKLHGDNWCMHSLAWTSKITYLLHEPI